MKVMKLRLKDGTIISIPFGKGKDGHTPKKGVDYYTPEERDGLVSEITESVTGDIGAALDELHAYAQTLVNGGAE